MSTTSSVLRAYGGVRQSRVVDCGCPSRTGPQGYRDMDAYTPMPVEGLSEAIGFRTNWVQRIVFIGGLLGATGRVLRSVWWMSVVAYPHIVAGRPLNSWPAYVPITFESMVLIACLTASDRDAGDEWLAAALSSGVSTFLNLYVRRGIDSSCVLRRPIRCFHLEKTRVFLEQLQPEGVMEVES